MLGGDGDAFQEEAKPTNPIRLCAHFLKEVVVLLAILLEEEAEIQKRLPKRALRTEHERDQETAKTAISVEEWMNRLELNVN